MAIFHNDHYDRFTVYPSECITALRGNADAMALHLYLLSKPSTWIPRASEIEDALGIGRRRRAEAFKVLASAGLAELKRDANKGSEWVIYATPRNVEAQEPAPRVVAIERKIASDNGFEGFWKAYPNKKGKGPASAKWARMTDAQRQLAMIDVSKRAVKDRDWLDQKGKYVPHCSTYLNQERWLDEWDSAATSYPDLKEFM